jgi:hypothetical protein
MQDIVPEIRRIKILPFGRTQIKRNPSGDQNMVTIHFGLPIILLGIVGGATSARVKIYS